MQKQSKSTADLPTGTRVRFLSGTFAGRTAVVTEVPEWPKRSVHTLIVGMGPAGGRTIFCAMHERNRGKIWKTIDE